MDYSGYNNGPDSYMEYSSPAVNGHSDASPGPKQQVKKTTQVTTITKQTVQTRVIRSPDGLGSPSTTITTNYDSQNYALPASYTTHPTDDYRGSTNESPYPGEQYDDDPNRQYNGTPSIDGSERQGYRGDPPRDQYDRSYNDTPSDVYVPSSDGGDRYGTAPRSQGAYDPPQPKYGERYDERPVDRYDERPVDRYDERPVDRYDERPVDVRGDSYNYSDPYDDRYHRPTGHPHDNWDSRMPPEEADYNGTYNNDGYHPDDITRETANEQMAPLASVDRTGSQDTVEYDKYDKDDPQWRTPDLQEIIDYLSHTNPAIVANAAGYLQHLTYGDDPIKNKTRSLGGIPILVELLGNPTPEIHNCACGALRNISFGKANEENKSAIKNAGGIPALIRLLRTTRDPDTKELVTGTLWNLSSSEPLKKPIIDDGLSVLVNDIIVPDSGWTPENPDNTLPTDYAWTPIYRNTTGCLRNVSSNGVEARKKMRECTGFIDALIHVIKSAIRTNNMDNKVVENTMCIIRNLSFKISNEANHPDVIPAPPPRSTAAQNGPGSPSKKKPDDSTGCFGGNKKKKMEAASPAGKSATSTLPRRGATWDPNTPIPERKRPPRGVELLFAHEMVRPYLTLLAECSKHVTLEATTGTIQNISSGEWVWALYIRAQLRKDKGLPVLVELLRMEEDKIVSAVARALRNLSLDSRNKELIGKYAMRDLVFRLPSASGGAANVSDDKQLTIDTLVAVLNALHELINMNPENSKSLRDASGIEKLVSITKSPNKYPRIVIKSAFQVLSTMWGFKDLRPLYKHDGWDEQHFSPGVWTTSKSPADKSQTLRTPSSERMSGPAPQRSASTPAGRLDFEASPLPAKSPPPLNNTPQPLGYNSYDRRQEAQQQQQPANDPYQNYRTAEPANDVQPEDHYTSLRQPAFVRDSMSAYSDEGTKAVTNEEPSGRAADQSGARDSLSQVSDEASSYVPGRQVRMPDRFTTPETRDSMSAYSEEAPSERSRDEIPMRELNYASIDHGHANDTGSRRGPPVGGVAVFGRDPQPRQDNVVYAQVNKDRHPSSQTYLDTGGPAGDSWV